MMVSTVVSTVCINYLLMCHACLLAYNFNEERQGGFSALKRTITVKHRPSWYYMLLR